MKRRRRRLPPEVNSTDMYGKPDNSSAGARTLQREVDEYGEWVDENLPRLSMRESSEIRRVIVRAVNETRVVRLCIETGGALAGVFVGFWMTGYWQGEISLSGPSVVGAAVCGAAFTFLASVWSKRLVHEKIKSRSEVM